jgi:hypothetical protein
MSRFHVFMFVDEWFFTMFFSRSVKFAEKTKYICTRKQRSQIFIRMSHRKENECHICKPQKTNSKDILIVVMSQTHSKVKR